MTRTRGYSGRYKVINKVKYIGDKKNIIYRSTWERSFCKWCDSNKKVIKWAIEPFEIPYFDKGKNKYRKYNPDFYLEMNNGNIYIIEIKPDHETKPPKSKRKTKSSILAEETYITNISKWNTAKKFCTSKNWKFRVLTEYTLKEMGIKIITNIKYKKKKRRVNNVKKTKKKITK